MGKQPYTEKRREANKKWDDANLKTCTVRMRLDMYAEFEKYCNDNGISKNAMINKCIADAIGYTVRIVQNKTENDEN